jgi:hypothetical protein
MPNGRIQVESDIASALGHSLAVSSSHLECKGCENATTVLNNTKMVTAIFFIRSFFVGNLIFSPKIKITTMKKSILIFLVSSLVISITASAQNLPYTANYSSNFKIGSNDLTKMVLQLYKDYEANDFNTHLGWISDTIMVFLPDGTTKRGKNDGVDVFKNARGSVGSSKFTFDAIIPLTSVDRKEDWVALWGNEETTDKANSSGSMKSEFQAIWRVNKDKKVDFIKIFSSKPGQQ